MSYMRVQGIIEEGIVVETVTLVWQKKKVLFSNTIFSLFKTPVPGPFILAQNACVLMRHYL